MRLLIVPLLILVVLNLSHAAMAFNCSGITLPSSIVICNDAELQKLADERLAAFEEAKTRLSEEEVQHLREDQALWVCSYSISCGVPADGTPHSQSRRASSSALDALVKHVWPISKPMAPFRASKANLLQLVWVRVVYPRRLFPRV